jgi:hypothetical protein
MKFLMLALIASMLLPSSASAEDPSALQQKVDRLESRLVELTRRLDNLGASSAMREVRTVDPVFMGHGRPEQSPLAMDDPTVNCPAHSFVTAIQLLKTGNTVTQLRYACRGF